MSLNQLGFRGLALLLTILLAGAPQYLAAQTAATRSAQTPQAQDQNGTQAAEQQEPAAQDAQSTTTNPDPSRAPLAPVPSARPAETNAVPPDAPSEVQRSQQAQQTTATAESQPATPQRTNPLGTATAQQGTTRGGVASKPAGEAIAPAKQRQVHSLLIKVGLLAAGAAAVGTVVGLTRGTSSVPPGAR